jgi:hypothetical protein
VEVWRASARLQNTFSIDDPQLVGRNSIVANISQLLHRVFPTVG